MWPPTSKLPRRWQFVFSRRLLDPAAEWPADTRHPPMVLPPSSLIANYRAGDRLDRPIDDRARGAEVQPRESGAHRGAERDAGGQRHLRVGKQVLGGLGRQVETAEVHPGQIGALRGAELDPGNQLWQCPHHMIAVRPQILE